MPHTNQPLELGAQLARLLSGVLPKMRAAISQSLGKMPDDEAARMLKIVAHLEGVRSQLLQEPHRRKAGTGFARPGYGDANGRDRHTTADFWPEVLEILTEDGKEMPVSAILKRVAGLHVWMPADLKTKPGRGHETKWKQDVRLALTQLLKQGLVHSHGNGVWSVTDAGKAKAQDHTHERPRRD